FVDFHVVASRHIDLQCHRRDLSFDIPTGIYYSSKLLLVFGFCRTADRLECIRIGSVSGLPNSMCLVCLLEFALSLDMSGWICSTSVMSASALNLTLHLSTLLPMPDFMLYTYMHLPDSALHLVMPESTLFGLHQNETQSSIKFALSVIAKLRVYFSVVVYFVFDKLPMFTAAALRSNSPSLVRPTWLSLGARYYTVGWLALGASLIT
ncbi:hypothetical protein Tco_0478496, partial [Tanacetum coccineum]